jgi:GDPmannose 4,6-dehydratase
MSVAIIFGASGQDGYYLTRLLNEQQVQVIAISRSEGFTNIDLSNYQAVSTIIKDNQPDYIFHLAANSTTQHAALFDNHAAMTTGTLNIFEAVKMFSPRTKVFISGSGLQFKNENKPINEQHAFEARDAYSASRIASVYMARYFRSLGLQIYVGYLFNHDSERRRSHHMTQKIALAAKVSRHKKIGKLEIGCIDTIKEYTHAKDVVEAIWMLVNQSAIYEAVIGSGKGYSIKDWLELCFGMAKTNWQDFVQVKNNFKPDYESLVADPKLICSLGWQPKISFADLGLLMMQ